MSGQPIAESHEEFGILFVPDHEMHRRGMAQDEAETWVAEWEAFGGVPGSMVVVKRTVTKTVWVRTAPQ